MGLKSLDQRPAFALVIFVWLICPMPAIRAPLWKTPTGTLRFWIILLRRTSNNFTQYEWVTKSIRVDRRNNWSLKNYWLTNYRPRLYHGWTDTTTSGIIFLYICSCASTAWKVFTSGFFIIPKAICFAFTLASILLDKEI